MKHVRLFNKADAFSHVAELTDDEFDRLLKPAREKRLPIDGATVDEELLEELLNRPNCKAKRISISIEMI